MLNNLFILENSRIYIDKRHSSFKLDVSLMRRIIASLCLATGLLMLVLGAYIDQFSYLRMLMGISGTP
jgi:hypothetical protein